MTILQSRVDGQVSSRFKQAARKRDLSPYQLLNELVKQTAAETSHGWGEHWARMKARKQAPLKQNAVVATREDED